MSESDAYWDRLAEEWETNKAKVRYDRKFCFVSWPIPRLRGEKRVIIEPKGIGYRWFLSDSTQLSNPGSCNKFAEGWTLSFGQAMREADRAA